MQALIVPSLALPILSEESLCDFCHIGSGQSLGSPGKKVILAVTGKGLLL